MTRLRKYVPNPEKHKQPKGYGSLCQKCITIRHAQELLDKAVADYRPTKRILYSVCGEAVFVARPTRIEVEEWHGYPEIGSKIDPKILDLFVQHGLIDDVAKGRIENQTVLPEACGCKQ